jgi:hypothetical protein
MPAASEYNVAALRKALGDGMGGATSPAESATWNQVDLAEA